jgi:hypothetical protein
MGVVKYDSKRNAGGKSFKGAKPLLTSSANRTVVQNA